MADPILKIEGLEVAVEDKPILKGVNLEIPQGEVHALMGPNGSGKSTLAYALAGHPRYEITGGSVFFDGKDLAEMEADERAQAGLFLAMQYPVEVPGVSVMNFLRSAVNATRGEEGNQVRRAWGRLARVRARRTQRSRGHGPRPTPQSRSRLLRGR